MEQGQKNLSIKLIQYTKFLMLLSARF